MERSRNWIGVEPFFLVIKLQIKKGYSLISIPFVLVIRFKNVQNKLERQMFI
jgi:hypothetical protein